MRVPTKVSTFPHIDTLKPLFGYIERGPPEKESMPELGAKWGLINTAEARTRSQAKWNEGKEMTKVLRMPVGQTPCTTSLEGRETSTAVKDAEKGLDRLAEEASGDQPDESCGGPSPVLNRETGTKTKVGQVKLVATESTQTWIDRKYRCN